MRIGWGVEGFGWVEDGSLERGGVTMPKWQQGWRKEIYSGNVNGIL